MPANNVGALTIELRTSMAQFQTDMGQATRTVQQTAAAMQRDFAASSSEAKRQVMLLGEAVGLHLPREVRRMMVEIPGVSSAINAAFAVAGPLAFAAIIVEHLMPLIKKLAASFTDVSAAERRAAEEKSLITHIQSLNAEALNLDKTLRLAGLSGIARAQEEIKINQEEMESGASRVKRIEAEIDGLRLMAQERRQFTTFTGSSALISEFPTAGALKAAADLKLKYIELAAAATEVQVAELRRGIATKTASADAVKAIDAEMVKRAAQLAQYTEAAMHLQITTTQSRGGALSKFGPGADVGGLLLQAPQTHDLSDVEAFNQKLADQRGWYDATRTQAEKYKIAVDALNASFMNDRSSDVYARAMKQIAQQYSDAGKAAQQFGKAVGDTLQQGILMGRSWSDVLKTLSLDLVKLIAQMTILKNLPTGGGGAGGFFSSLLSGFFGGGRAGGGSVVPGTSYLVGESGPEMFTPGVRGSISPNSALGGQIVYQNCFNNADPRSEERILRCIQASHDDAIKQSIRGTHELNLRR